MSCGNPDYPKLLPGNIVYAGPVGSTGTQGYYSLAHIILEKFKSFGNQIIMIDAAKGIEYSAKLMHESIIRMAQVLLYMGVESNDVIGLCSENSFEFALVLYAALAINATVAPLNVIYSESEFQYAINLSKPKILFASKMCIDRAVKAAKNNDFVKKVIFMGINSSYANVISLMSLMQNKLIPSCLDYKPPKGNKYEDVALIVCSSGTTGMPKGVQLTHNNILSTMNSAFDPSAPKMTDINLLTVIPWFHSFGCLTLISSGIVGACLVFLPKFEEHLFLSAIERYRVLMAFTVPPLMVFLAKHPMVSQYDLSSLMMLLCGAAPLSKEIEDQIKARIGVPIIRQGYGLTESTLVLLVQNDYACKPGSVGALKVGLWAKVIDPHTGKALGANERGELCFKGDCIMKGYIGDAKATQTLIKDGWLHTGDIGYFDEDFEFFIVDRIKELIKYKGYQVAPAEIEALLQKHPKIKEAAVIGKPDEDAGELPMAFVVKQSDGNDLTEHDVIQFVAEHASPIKKLRGGVMFVQEIPKNVSGKILRRVLRNMLKKNMSKL